MRDKELGKILVLDDEGHVGRDALRKYLNSKRQMARPQNPAEIKEEWLAEDKPKSREACRRAFRKMRKVPK